jgi:hypothetical protein
LEKRDAFGLWLNEHRKIKPITLKKYINALDIVSTNLGSYGIDEKYVFEITEQTTIDTILANVDFVELDEKSHRYYSAPLNHYKKFLSQCVQTETEGDYYDDGSYQDEIYRQLVNSKDDQSLGEFKKVELQFRITSNTMVWKRNPKIAIGALNRAGFLCELDVKHKHFISKSSGKNYVEAHHLIPMEFQIDYKSSLDIDANIVSLCLVCHKMIHFGRFEDKEEMIDRLFELRKKSLIRSGIKITRETLMSYYAD